MRTELDPNIRCPNPEIYHVHALRKSGKILTRFGPFVLLSDARDFCQEAARWAGVSTAEVVRVK